MKGNYIPGRIIALFCFLFVSGGQSLFGQPGCPTVDAGPDVTVGCGNNCTTLTATVVPTGTTNSYAVNSIPYSPPFAYNSGTPILVNQDDIWSSVITLPFTFCFYNNNFTQIVVGSNGLLSFDVSGAGGSCNWSYTDACPSPNLPLNCIFGVYQDIDPTYQGLIRWQFAGTAPCRMLVVSWYQIPYFGDPNSVNTSYCNSPLYATSQIVLYESTNVIEVYVKDKELCSSWNSGNGLIGIQNGSGTSGLAPPGRNTSQWTAHNEAWRFYPNGSSGVNVTWFNGATQIGTGTSLQVCPNATTTYTSEAVYTTCTGSTVTATDQVTVNYNGNFAINVNPTSASLCPGDNVTLTASAPPNVTFTWTPAAGLNTTSGPTVTATPAVTTTYTVTGVDNTNCSMSIPITLTVSPFPAITITPPNAVICGGSSVTLTAHGADTYVWSPATGLSSTTDSVVIANPSGTTTYFVTGSIGSCTAQGSVTVSMSPTLNIGISPPNPIICAGDSVGLTASGADNYTWSPPDFLSGTSGGTVTASPPSTTSYTVNGSSSSGCTGSTIVTVTLSSGALLSFSPQDPAICEGASIQIQVFGATNYLWSPPAGLSTNVGYQVIASPLSTITYTVTADPNGCTATATIVVTVDPIPQVDFSSDVTEGCEDLMVQFFDLTNPAPITWAWDFGDGTGTNPYTHVSNPLHLFENPGKYDITLLVTSANGCQAQLTIDEMISVFKEPVAAFYTDPQQSWITEPHFNFFDESINASDWLWNFGEINALDNYSVYQHPSHTYADTGYYTVTLIVTSPDGCVDTVSKQIIIKPLITFYIPNAFTPTNDGKNDIFMVAGIGIKEETFVLRIFDRWGQEVFFSKDINKGWDGKIAGTDMTPPTGTYCYIISVKDIKANHHEFKGLIHLIR
jgi:gliding motility-associated-like protein